MATLYITEFSNIAYDAKANLMPMGAEPPVAEQTVTIAGTSDQSDAVNTATSFVRIHTDVACHVAVGSNPTATTSSRRLAADQTEFLSIPAGYKIAVIEAA